MGSNIVMGVLPGGTLNQPPLRLLALETRDSPLTPV